MYFDDNNDEKRKICVYDRELEFAQRKLLNREGRGGRKTDFKYFTYFIGIFVVFLCKYYNIPPSGQ